MKVLYIGQYTDGTTSKMRAETLRQVLHPEVFNVIDSHVPFYRTRKLWRSLAFRYKWGPTVKAINVYIQNALNTHKYDLIWVDKATFIQPDTTICLRKQTKILVHFTPDMMFYANKSRAFIKSIPSYDLLVTSKSKELPLYQNYIDLTRVKLVTQGFDPAIHKAQTPFKDKDDVVVFIGLAEPSRERIIHKLIDAGIQVNLAGYGWEAFVNKHTNNKCLNYLGRSLYGETYSAYISKAKLGLGLLSKRFPELHTTRTFEIPACGTALLTEYNDEMATLFAEDEVIFFDTAEDLVKRIRYFLSHPEALETLTKKGQYRAKTSGYDYESIIKKVLNQVNLCQN